jgi:hypothetical protein
MSVADTEPGESSADGISDFVRRHVLFRMQEESFADETETDQLEGSLADAKAA